MRHSEILEGFAPLLIAYLPILTVSFLYGSILILISRSFFSKFITLLGIAILMIIRYDPFYRLPSFKDRSFWQLLAIAGCVIYLMGTEKPQRENMIEADND